MVWGGCALPSCPSNYKMCYGGLKGISVQHLTEKGAFFFILLEL
ncbi:hypothetical protein SLEP1_g13623 [Rubroshorea leprosula]|uniref:Uncharacterized protein n=1 Tax=Rubroshorea leprosula TaxID=152421 RepID=A0AAV5IPJ2_9ROSI|nr:hypothetical protein SLEP1_g13623 [Rubroshorea leprosula]